MRTKPTLLITLGTTLLACSSAIADQKDQSWTDAQAFQGQIDLSGFRSLAVQEGGRRKPIDTFAREYVFKITDRKSFQGLDPVYMVLSLSYELQSRWLDRRMIAVRNLDLIDLLEKDNTRPPFKTRKRTGDRLFVSIRDFQHCLNVQRVFREASNKQQKKIPRSSIEEAALSLGERVFMATSLRTLMTIVPSSDTVDDKWTTISGAKPELFASLQQYETKLVAALRADSPDPAAFNTAMTSICQQIKAYDFKVYPYYGLIELELAMNRYKPFQTVQLVYLLAIIALIIGCFGSNKAKTAGFALFAIGLTVHVLALTGRGFLVSRSPVASLYETLIFMTGFAAVLALVLELIGDRKGWFALGASIVCTLGLFLGDWHPIYADKQAISPLVPVLRSYWLNIHVTCMISAYGACLLAASMGFVYLFRYCLNGGRPSIVEDPSMLAMDNYIYRTIQVGFLLLTIGVILGGVWANQSWGRYWDWDPKETWAFISWIVYAAYLHLRLGGYARQLGAAIMSLVGFWFIMFTYLGVSYVLPGLHSYVPPGKNDISYLIPFIIAPVAIAGAFGILLLIGKSLHPKNAKA